MLDVEKPLAKQRAQEVELPELERLRRVRDALYGDDFTLYAQPIFELSNGRVIRHELLLRMHENGRVIGAADFVDLIEAYGPIREVDRWVVRAAAGLAGTGWRVNVNLSDHSIDGEFPEFVRARLASEGVLPGGIVFEVKEAQLVRDRGASREFAWAVRELGCGLALDDFGRGDRQLSFVRELPISYLKIDGALTGGLVRDEASREVVRAIVRLAAEFEQLTVAEQVEDLATLQTLEELGVDQAQGFALGIPAPLEGAEETAEPVVGAG
jgi:EAL domain-containing protein (putative c-di-GMP-specific phosphodiesterase class I)